MVPYKPLRLILVGNQLSWTNISI